MSKHQQAPMAQRSLEKRYFNHKDMDYYLSWVIGRQFFDGSDPEESLAVASRITDGDPASWQREWLVQAQQVESAAAAAAAQADTDTARRLYLRACTYFRAPLFMMDPKDPAFRENWRKQQDCFRAAMPYFPFPIEAIEVPYQGKTLHGYAWRPIEAREPRPTLLVVGGMETFAEDCYFVVGNAPLERGYNVIALDLPGQGINPYQGLYLEADMGAAVRVLIDYAVTRPEVDPQRLALFGISWGGHIVLQGAEGEPRLKALIANPPMPDVFKAGLAQQSGNGRGDPVNQLIFQQLAWRFGLQLTAIRQRLVKAYQYLVHGKADVKKIHCATLCMAGEGEAKITLDLARQTFEKLPHPQKKLAILTKAEGGEAHCQVNNLPLLNQVILDWLATVDFGVAARKEAGGSADSARIGTIT